MARVVLGEPFDIPEAEGQVGPRALERLDLALLIDAQHQRMVGRVEIEPDDVPHFLDEEGIGRQLEARRPVGLNAEQRDVALDRAPDAGLPGDRPDAPVGGAGLEHRARHPRDLVVVVRQGAPDCGGGHVWRRRLVRHSRRVALRGEIRDGSPRNLTPGHGGGIRRHGRVTREARTRITSVGSGSFVIRVTGTEASARIGERRLRLCALALATGAPHCLPCCGGFLALKRIPLDPLVPEQAADGLRVDAHLGEVTRNL